MDFLLPAVKESSFLKACIDGFPGTGKTRTATEIAIGLHKYIQSKKPVAFVDSEGGSDYVMDLFQGNKIELLRQKARNRNFLTLMGACEEASKLCDIMIVDSITHFWWDLVASFMKKQNIDRMKPHHWMPLKQEWRKFSEFFVGSRLHFIFCGRAGWDFDYFEDAEGFKELEKSGVKMKVEGDTAFEPSLCLRMELVRSEGQRGKIGGTYVNRAWVLKDRFPKNSLMGKFFDLAEGGEPLQDTFECFLPHIKQLSIGGQQTAIGHADSQAAFSGPSSRSEEFSRREIYLEEIEQEMKLRVPGRSDADRQLAIKILRALYGTAASAALKQCKADFLEQGLKRLQGFPAEWSPAMILDDLEPQPAEAPKAETKGKEVTHG